MSLLGKRAVSLDLDGPGRIAVGGEIPVERNKIGVLGCPTCSVTSPRRSRTSISTNSPNRSTQWGR